MFNQIYESLTCRIKETTATLPRVQQIVVHKCPPGNLMVSVYESEPWYKFWMMSDGTVVPVKRIHNEISDSGVKIYGTDDSTLMGSGALRGHIDAGAKFMAIQYAVKPTDDQIEKLKRLFVKYRVTSVEISDWKKLGSGVDTIGNNVKSPNHLEYMIRYGKIDEASLSDLQRKQRTITWLFPTFHDRVSRIQDMGGLRLTSVDDDNWDFKVHSGTKKDVWYDCVIHFKNIPETLAKYVRDKRLWVSDKSRIDLRKLAGKFISGVNVQTFCSCPADIFYGGHYIRGKPQYDAKYTNPEHRPPRKRNPNQYGAYCFDDRAMVLMSDGTFKSIRDVKIGDSVFTHTGGIHKVVNTFHREAEVINVSINGVLGEFGVTPGHKFYTRGRNNKCLCGCGKELSNSSGIINHYGVKHLYSRKFTSGHAKRKQVIDDKSMNLIWSEVGTLDRYSMLYTPTLKFGDEIIIDPNIARLVGYYIAEGSLLGKHTNDNCTGTFVNSKGKLIRGTGIVFTISNEEINTIGADIVRILKQKFGVVARIRKVDYTRSSGVRSRYTQISVHNKPVYELMNELVGFNKSICNNILRWNFDGKVQLLLGWFLGDGCFQRGCYCTFVSSSEILSQQLFSLIQSIGIRPRIKKYRSTNTSGFVGSRFYVDMPINEVGEAFIKSCSILGKTVNCGSKKFETFRGSGCSVSGVGNFRMFRKIDHIISGKSMVYNIEVEDDNSYIVNGVAVHNCKHTALIMKAMPFYTNTVAKWLRDFYGEEISKLEVEAKKAFGWARSAAGELRKRVEPEREKKPVRRPGIRVGKTHLSPEEIEEPGETRARESISIMESEDEKLNWFTNRTNRHVSLVKKAAYKIYKVYPEFKGLLDRAKHHDDSKFEEPERTPYISITWRHKLENERGKYDPINSKGYQRPGLLKKEDENAAVLRHITTNSHHPEYHLKDKSEADVSNKGGLNKCVDASAMPDLDIAEMVSDWQAMSEELGTNTAREWFDKQRDVRWHFSPHQVELINKILRVFEED